MDTEIWPNVLTNTVFQVRKLIIQRRIEATRELITQGPRGFYTGSLTYSGQ